MILPLSILVLESIVALLLYAASILAINKPKDKVGVNNCDEVGLNH